jgi:site-specific DNA recombinase
MKKAGAIIRVSTTRQLEGTSPEKQLEKILIVASEQGYDIDQKYIWQLAESGGARERVGFSEALKAGAKGEISRVYVFNTDRLGRDLLEMLLFLRQLDDMGVDCWGAEKGQQLKGDDFIFQIEGALAGRERQEILCRTQDGLLRAIKGGKYSGGIVAYGYRINTESKKLEIELTEAEVVRMMFGWCVDERISCVKIADRLNAMGIPTRYQKDGRLIRRKGKRVPEKTDGIWRAGRVRNMIRNPGYMGRWEWGKRSKKRRQGDIIPGYCPPIVSAEIFTKAGNILTQNQLLSTRNGHRQYLLRGLIKCDICGKTFCGSYSMVGPNRSKEKAYYQCNGKTQWRKLGKPRCSAPSLRAEEIESVVWEDIKNFCKSPSIVLDQLRSQRKPLDESMKDILNKVTAQITELKRQEINLIRIAATSLEVKSQTLDELLSENHKEQDELIAYKADLETKDLRSRTLEDDLIDVASRLAQLGDRIEQASFEERRRAVEELVKEIRVQPQAIDGKLIPVVIITYRFNEPGQIVIPPPATMIIDHTPAPAVISAIRSNLAPVLRWW